MVELTAGYVAGVIALGIVIARVWCPNAIAFILAGQLHDRETAATWTVAARFLQSSYWPLLLQTDSSKNNGVRRSVVWTTLAVPLITILISLAGIITPLGLYERDEVDDDLIPATFEYVRDSSAFYMGTSSSRDVPFTRTCSIIGSCLVPCPYTSDVVIIESNGISANCSMPYRINSTVPEPLHEIYGSATNHQRTTLSGFFDIGWRQLTTQYDRLVDNGTLIPSGTFRLLESFTLDEAIRPVEGLVVDGINGGIGFRNHTIPKGHSRGVTWTEDLLFIEPEVECVDNNITLDFDISTGSREKAGTAILNMFMTDRGGFANINTTSPVDDQRNGINAPDLKTRAYQGAWFGNAFTMLYLDLMDPTNNATGTKAFRRLDSEVGKKFQVPIAEYSHSLYNTFGFYKAFGFNLGITSSIPDLDKETYENPHNVTFEDFEWSRQWCQQTPANAAIRLNNTYVTCSLVRGVPRRVDDGSPTIFEDNSTWTAPIYTCASAVKATIKTVTFFHNGTSEDLSNLVIREIKDKEYPSEEDWPLWGVEDFFTSLSSFSPIWALVHEAYEGFKDVLTIKAPSLYLLGSANSVWADYDLDTTIPFMNIPGAIAPIAAMNTVASKTTDSTSKLDLTAATSMSKWLKFRELTGSAETLPLLFKLLWTDLAASAMVGTKGVLGQNNAHPERAAQVLVRATVHQVKYHWEFGIPAFLTALVMGIILLAVTASVFTGQSNTRIMDQRLKQVSLGRVLTTLFSPGTSTLGMSSKEWSQANADKQLDMAGGPPNPIEPPLPHEQQPQPHMNGQYSAVPPQPTYSPQPYEDTPPIEQVQGSPYYPHEKTKE